MIGQRSGKCLIGFVHGPGKAGSKAVGFRRRRVIFQIGFHKHPVEPEFSYDADGSRSIPSFRRPDIGGLYVLVAEALNLVLSAFFIKADFGRGHDLTATLALGIELDL